MENNLALAPPVATPAPAPEAKKRIIYNVGPRAVDFTDPPPITGGDRRKIHALGIDMRKFVTEAGLDPDEEAKLLHYLVKRKGVDPEATQEEVDDIPTNVQQSMLQHFLSTTKNAANPFRPPSSTSLPTSTAGEAKT